MSCSSRLTTSRNIQECIFNKIFLLQIWESHGRRIWFKIINGISESWSAIKCLFGRFGVTWYNITEKLPVICIETRCVKNNVDDNQPYKNEWMQNTWGKNEMIFFPILSSWIFYILVKHEVKQVRIHEISRSSLPASKSITDGPTDQPTDGRTNRRTDTPSYRTDAHD